MFSISARTEGGVLPPIFVNKFTQKRDAAGDIITRPGLSITSGQFIGVQNEAGGEAAELMLYKHLGKPFCSLKISCLPFYCHFISDNIMKCSINQRL